MNPVDFFSIPADRSFHVTDTVGGPWGDITQRIDIDSRILISLRSGWLNHHEVLDSFGREGIIPYIASETVRVHEDLEGDIEGKTLLLCNTAPRDGTESENGSNFYTARFGESLQVIGHLAAFSHLKSRMDHLYQVNGFESHEQFRSSHVERFSRSASHLEDSKDVIAEIPDPSGVQIGRVDRFGSIILLVADPDAFDKELESQVDSEGKVRISIKGKTRRCRLQNGDLKDFANGELTVYRDKGRGGRHSIAWGWLPGISTYEKVKNSPYYQFSDPIAKRFVKEGDSVEIV